MGFLDQMKQLMEVKQKMEEAKKRLDAIEVTSENNHVLVTVSGNRKVKSVQLKNTADKTELEARLTEALNDALAKADNVMQSEMMSATKGMLPDGMPGMGQ